MIFQDPRERFPGLGAIEFIVYGVIYTQPVAVYTKTELSCMYNVWCAL